MASDEPPTATAGAALLVDSVALGAARELDATPDVDDPVGSSLVVELFSSWKIPGWTVGGPVDRGTSDVVGAVVGGASVDVGGLGAGGGGGGLGPPSSEVTTIFATDPRGTVTTQKPSPLPDVVPVDETMLLRPFVGSILQGRPLQPPPSHWISSPYVGFGYLPTGSSSHTGFQPILRNVLPVPSVLPPAT